MCSCIVRQCLVPRAGGLLERGPIGGVRLSRPVGPSCWMCVAHRMSPPVQSPNDDRAIARINHRLRLCNERRHTTSDTHATSFPKHRCRFHSGSADVHDEPPYHCWPDRSAPPWVAPPPSVAPPPWVAHRPLAPLSPLRWHVRSAHSSSVNRPVVSDAVMQAPCEHVQHTAHLGADAHFAVSPLPSPLTDTRCELDRVGQLLDECQQSLVVGPPLT